MQMNETDKHQLLAEFARCESETAFATIVSQHVNLVYSTALRFTNDPHHAEEVTQAVFIILARKAGTFSPRVVLSGWLYQTTRLTAANFMRGELRRQQREQEAYMQSTLNEPETLAWAQIAPLLDEAMGRLGETDRAAVVLRFFENKTAAEVAAALGTTEAAAHKRVSRALEKLRQLFHKRGVMLTASLIGGTVAANSVQAAPASLAQAISTVALAKGAAAGGSTLTLAKGVLKFMAWTKAKTAIAITAGALLTAGTVTITVEKLAQPSELKAQPGTPGQTDFPKTAWRFAGYGTPEDSLQSMFWAMREIKINVLLNGLTPKARATTEKEIKDSKLSESQIRQQFARGTSQWTGYQLIKREITNDEITIVFLMTDTTRTGVKPGDLRLKKVGAEWKVDEEPW